MFMKCLLLASYLLLAYLPLWAQLDNTFSGNGKVTAKIAGQPTYGYDMVIQPDQNILVAGSFDYGATTGFAVMRFTPDGTLDQSFGSGGKVSLIFPNYIFGPVKVGLQSTKKIVLMGEFGLPNEGREAVLVRLTPNGALDLSFSPTGYIVIPEPIQAYAMAIQPDDKILVGGNGGPGLGVNIFRYSPDGVMDTQFGTNGLATVAGGSINGMCVGSGRIFTVGGGTGANWTQVSCFTSNGFPDPHFGSGGVTPVNANGHDVTSLSGVNVTADGFILAVGEFLPTGNNTHYRLLVVRLRPDGLLDPAFSGNGKLGVPFPSGSVFGTGVLMDFQGLIYAAGVVESAGGGVNKFGLCRVNMNGTLDTRFGDVGVLTTGWSGVYADANAIAQQSNGKIVLAGSAGAIAVARYNNPFIPPPPPVVTALDSGAVESERRANLGSATAVRVFPNPVRSMLKVQGLDVQGSAILLVRDAVGKTMMSVKVERQSEYSLDVHRLGAGMYFLEVVSGDGPKSFPFVKEP